MSELIKNELSQICTLVGSKIPVWTQGAGGNISIKEGETLWIKATGYRLDAVTPYKGIAHVDFKKMAQVLESSHWSESEAEQKYANLIQETTLPGPGLGRASMETGFHARLPGKYVLHFHSLAGLFICHEFNKDRNKVDQWLKSKTDLTTEFIEPCRPGWILSKRVSGTRAIYFLESHGIILQSEDSNILEEWNFVEKAFCRDFKYAELLELLTTEAAFDSMFEAYGTKPIPFKCYFPDVAVFADRLHKVLKKDRSGFYSFSKDTVAADRDMAELWLATQMLYQFCPDFSEVPIEISRIVKDLPTEKLRQKEEFTHG